MKELKKINLKGVSDILSDDEMKIVVGGIRSTGTCGWTTNQGGVAYYDCGVSKEEAIQMAGVGTNGYWCCDSCSQTTYCG